MPEHVEGRERLAAFAAGEHLAVAGEQDANIEAFGGERRRQCAAHIAQAARLHEGGAFGRDEEDGRRLRRICGRQR